MTVAQASVSTGIRPAGDLVVNVARFRRHIRAIGLSPRTEQSYLESVDGLVRFLADRGMPLDTAAVSREHILHQNAFSELEGRVGIRRSFVLRGPGGPLQAAG